MKKAIVTFACALIAPLAFAQTSSKGTRQGTTTAETITITGTMVTETSEEARPPVISLPELSLFARTPRIILAVMSSTDRVTL